MDLSRDRQADRLNLRSDTSRGETASKLTVPEAAELLGVTQSAVRKRIQRGTIPWHKGDEGRLYVCVDRYETRPETDEDKLRNTSSGRSRDELLEAYREQVEFLYQELERKDAIITSLARRTPGLVAAPEGNKRLP